MFKTFEFLISYLFRISNLITERFEPSSRTILIGEQPNAWELLHPRAMVSRHRRVFTSVTGRSGLYLHPFNQSKGGGVLATTHHSVATPFS